MTATYHHYDDCKWHYQIYVYQRYFEGLFIKKSIEKILYYREANFFFCSTEALLKMVFFKL